MQEKNVTKLEFAHGSEPQDGENTIFEALVEEVEYQKPKENKKGVIDHRENLHFTQVEPGTALMKRIPAKPGTNGQNVKGQVIPAIEGIEIPYNEDLPGTRISEEDENLLLSAEKGHPVILADGVRVDKTITVNNVDMSTGNINYDGSLMVKGEIMPGMKVKVTGDIVVQGVVTKASLYAKNNISIHCGIIGADPSKENEESLPTDIKAGGNITAQYITLANLSAGNNIEVKEYISYCTTEAKNRIFVGQSGGKGRIFGGVCHAQSGIAANAVGADGNIKTLVSAGTPHHQQKQFEQLLKTHQNRIDQAEKLNAMLEKYNQALKEDPENVSIPVKIEAINKVLSEINSEIEKMENTISKITLYFREARSANIIVKKKLYPNVIISINGADFNIRQESKGGTFVKMGNDIRWNN